MEAVRDPQRSLALAEDAYARFDVEGMVAHLSAAVRTFTADGDVRAAAMACLRLGDVLAYAMGNLTAGRAWFTRAVRLLADEAPCVEQGWAAVAAMGCDVGDPDELLAAAELALERARHFGDLNLETKALADGGLAHVQAGRYEQGFAMLDEAMALACGPADDGDAAGKSACSFFTACYYTSSFDRADDWAAMLRQHGLIGAEAGGPAFLSNHCASLQGAALLELGRWGEAEELLVAATDRFQATMGTAPFHSAIELAELRIRQGRLTDAEVLLAAKAQAFEAMLPSARLHLARGAHDLARAVARRGLRALGADRQRAIGLLEVLVHAEVATGDAPAARQAAAELAERAAGATATPVVAARTALATAAALAAAGDVAAAVAALEEALEQVPPRRAPWRRALLHLALARLHDQQGDQPAATAEADAASALFDAMDVVVPATDAELLRRLAGGPATAPADVAEAATLTRTGRTWTAAYRGRGVQLRDSKGMRYLSELLAAPGIEHHALDLVDRVVGTDASGVDRRRLGDAGPALDSRARGDYRRRIEELRERIDDSLAGQRFDEAEALQAEHDVLVAELARAFGLAGRPRPIGSAAERARLNVTRSLRTATSRVAEALPEAGAALDRHLRTGLYCTYDPPRNEIRWIVHRGLNGIPRS